MHTPTWLRHRRIAVLIVVLVVLAGGTLRVEAPAQAHGSTAAPAAPALTYGTYLGGMSSDEATGVAVAATGEIYVLGATHSEDFLGQAISISGYSDLFVAKFNAAGTELLYLTTIGSDSYDNALSLALDGQGNAYVTAFEPDDTFPTQNALWATRPENADCVLFKLDGQGKVVYSTYLPFDDTYDARHNLAVDAAGNAYVTGTYRDVHEGETYLGNQIGLLKISPDGSQVLLDKQIGGANHDSARAITLDPDGAIYVAGITESPNQQPGSSDFPVTANAHQTQCGDIVYEGNTYCDQDGVVLVLNAAGQVTYASFHGGSSFDDPQAIAADGKGTVLLAGHTRSTRFPLVNPLQPVCPIDEEFDMCFSRYGFVSAIRIRPDKSTLLFSTHLGSTERISWTIPTVAALDDAGNAYVAGHTQGEHLPVKDALQPLFATAFCSDGFGDLRECYDGFLIKLAPTGALAYGSYLGGHHDEYLWGMTVESGGAVYLAGMSAADDFPTTEDGYQPQALPNRNGFLVRIDFAGSLPTGSVAGVVYVDKDGDGQQDVDEAGVAEVNVTLHDADAYGGASGAGATFEQQTKTDAEGVYRFDGVPAGAYTLTFTPPAGFTLPGVGTAPVTVEAGQTANVPAVSVRLPQVYLPLVVQ